MTNAPFPSLQECLTSWADVDSVAYKFGYSQGFEDREFRNPCEGNSTATRNHYFGFHRGTYDRTGKGYDWTAQVAA